MRMLHVVAMLITSLTVTGNSAHAIPLDQVLPGQVLITEIMANPAGLDTQQEWFEVYNPLPVPIDLSDMIVSSNNGSFTVTGGSHIIDPGALFVFARSDDPAINGGLPVVDYAWDQALTLHNNSGQLTLAQAGGSSIVSASWAAALNGTSLELIGGALPDPLSFDSPVSPTFYGTQSYPSTVPSSANLGTPGASNSLSFTGLATTPLLINEIMANPDGEDSLQEWFEIYNPGAPFDLNGVTITTGTGSFTVSGTHIVGTGELFVFARSDDMVLNGGLPVVDYAWGDALTLVNANGQLSLIAEDDGGLIVDAHWSSAGNGVSLELVSDGTYESTEGTFYGPQESDSPGPLVMNSGTPGAQNQALFVVEGIPPYQPQVAVSAPSTLTLLLCALTAWFATRGFSRRLSEPQSSRETYLPSDQIATHPLPLKVVLIPAFSSASQTGPASPNPSKRRFQR